MEAPGFSPAKQDRINQALAAVAGAKARHLKSRCTARLKAVPFHRPNSEPAVELPGAVLNCDAPNRLNLQQCSQPIPIAPFLFLSTTSPRTKTKAQPSLSRLKAAGLRGFSLVELVVAMTILMILTAAATPVVRVVIQRGKERELRRDLWMMRDAIDRYKDAADRGAFQTKLDSQGYPPDLDTLVKGVDTNGKKMRFLRRIPVDPMTGKDEWGMRSIQDDPDSDSWGGRQRLRRLY